MIDVRKDANNFHLSSRFLTITIIKKACIIFLKHLKFYIVMENLLNWNIRHMYDYKHILKPSENTCWTCYYLMAAQTPLIVSCHGSCDSFKRLRNTACIHKFVDVHHQNEKINPLNQDLKLKMLVMHYPRPLHKDLIASSWTKHRTKTI